MRNLTQFRLLAMTVALASAAHAEQAATATSGDGGTAEIVVTAQKRSENVQDVPIAISTFTASALQERAIGNGRGGSDWPSQRDFSEGYMLTEAAMDWFMAHYAAPEEDPRHACLLGDIPGEIPLLVHVAGLDPLRDQGRAYAARARAAGAPSGSSKRTA